ncbi:hypothetical protein FB451DRAFT_1392680 [Mycena latifolia]|nr:hypothetical protein FB451DRAFT_1392680 [Mycena latifolia]
MSNHSFALFLWLPALALQRTSPAQQTEAAFEWRCSPGPRAGVASPTFDPAYASCPRPSALAAMCLLLALYVLCTRCTALALDAAAGSGASFPSFTQLSYIGVAAYLGPYPGPMIYQSPVMTVGRR